MEINMFIDGFLFTKKERYVYSLIFIFLSATSSCTKDSPIDEYAKEIVVDGNLQSTITFDNLRLIERLTIKGKVSYEDWNILYEMALTGHLSYLDLTDAEIRGDTHLDRYKDNEIPSFQFSGSKTLQTVLLPKGLKGIGTKAFSSCTNLNVVSFPSSLEFVGNEAFAYCSMLASIDLPQSVDSIGVRAFYQSALTGDFIIPKGLRIVSKQAFAQTRITSVRINHDVLAAKDTKMYTINNNSVFASCKDLQKVIVEEGCTRLEIGFTNCELLTDVILPSTLKYIGGYSESTHNYIFKGCKSISHIELPEGLSYIGMYAFDSARFHELNIPKSIEHIGKYSFHKANIPVVKVHWDIPLNIDGNAFDAFNFDNSVLYVPRNTSHIYRNQEYWGRFSKILESPSI